MVSFLPHKQSFFRFAGQFVFGSMNHKLQSSSRIYAFFFIREPFSSLKTQVTESRCICFCLKLNSRHYIEAKEFKEVNWLPTKERVEKPVATNVFKYGKGTSPFYVNKLFVPSRNIQN